MAKRLHLLRHAKSSWSDTGLADYERPLAPRGLRACELVAEHLRERGIEPALVLCSSAVRSCQTLEAIADGLGEGFEVRVEDRIYAASVEGLLERLGEVPDELESVMVIGHQPAIGGLALRLGRGGTQLEDLRRKFPTAALASLELAGPWTDLAPGVAELTGFVKPKQLDSARA
ncbi:MAG: histidine phosphatase family protein [Solirubrobacterales bacterium]|nr:histidine phosphatase family protein [Solirubrobacterales bacterium]